MTDAAVFDKQGVTLNLSGITVTVSPLLVGKIPKVLRIVRPILSSVSGELDVLTLIAEHGDTIIDLVSEATGVERTKVEDLGLDDFITLAETVLTVNADFFSKKVVPAMGRITESLTSAKG